MSTAPGRPLPPETAAAKCTAGGERHRIDGRQLSPWCPPTR